MRPSSSTAWQRLHASTVVWSRTGMPAGAASWARAECGGKREAKRAAARAERTRDSQHRPTVVRQPDRRARLIPRPHLFMVGDPSWLRAPRVRRVHRRRGPESSTWRASGQMASRTPMIVATGPTPTVGSARSCVGGNTPATACSRLVPSEQITFADPASRTGRRLRGLGSHLNATTWPLSRRDASRSRQEARGVLAHFASERPIQEGLRPRKGSCGRGALLISTPDCVSSLRLLSLPTQSTE